MESKINIRNIFEAFIIILIIADLVMLMLITFTNVNSSLYVSIIYFDLMVCVILFFDFIYRMRRETDKKQFIKENWPDIIAMIPFDIFALDPTYVFFARFLRIFRLARLFALFRREWKYISSFFKQTHINFAFGMLLFTLFAGTIIFYIVENGVNPSIHSFWDAMWFTVTTMVAGNSNISPATYDGEAISVLMMLIGVSFVGVLTASLASWLMSKSQKTEDEREERIKNIETSLQDIKKEIAALSDLLKKE